MNAALRIYKEWTLPISIAAGTLIFLAFHLIGFLSPLKGVTESFVSYFIPVLVFVMLFFTFCKINPAHMQVKKWHLILVAFQLISCGLIGGLLFEFPSFPYRIAAEGAMVCLIAPTATAAAVITGKLGGNEASLTSYTITSNLAAAIAIPLVFPLIEGKGDTSFIHQLVLISRQVFPLLIFPFFVAWGIRVFLPKVLDIILRYCGSVAFYLWGIALMVVVGQTLRSIVNSNAAVHLIVTLSVVGLVACCVQFAAGKIIGGWYNDRISGGQGLGQKNTVFAIWVSYTYLIPITSIAPGSYILWQNIINSWQLWHYNRVHNNKQR